VSVATTTAMLRPVDQAYLDENFVWEAVVAAGMVCVTIKGYPLALGLAPAVNELFVRLPAGFPDAGPDMFWFAEPVERVDGTPIPATEITEIHLGRSWQRWSRHIGSRWRPGVDDLRTYMAYVATCIRSAAQ
jgi:hypothetical protein